MKGQGRVQSAAAPQTGGKEVPLQSTIGLVGSSPAAPSATAPPSPRAPGEAASWLRGILGRVGAPLSSLQCWLGGPSSGLVGPPSFCAWQGGGVLGWDQACTVAGWGALLVGVGGRRDALGLFLGCFPCCVTQPDLEQQGGKGARLSGCWDAGDRQSAQQGVRQGGHEGTAVLQPVGMGTPKPEVFSVCFSHAQLQKVENCSPGPAAPFSGQPEQQLPGQQDWKSLGCAGARAASQRWHPSSQGWHPSPQRWHPSSQGRHPSSQGRHPSQLGAPALGNATLCPPLCPALPPTG